jgi:hypothetical protein
MNAQTLCALCLLALTTCDRPQPVQLAAPAQALPPAPSPFKPGTGTLDTLAPEDLVGYLTGNYHTSSNNPAIYADRDRKVFVMMGKRAKAELPLDKPEEAMAAFEKFLVLHGYAANGKQPTDDHSKVMVDGKEMVVMTSDELFPKMPDELKAHFTQTQFDLLYRTAPREGFHHLAATHPLIWAYTQTLVVLGSGVEKEFPVAQADDAFAEYRRLIAK